MGRLDRYLEKRDFALTPEPRDPGTPNPLAPRFSFQKHDATRLHWDLRLEHDGVLLSWAVTRGPSLNPADKRLAVRTEDHPLSYLTFEGTIPKGEYGGGTVMLWDLGWWQPFHDVEAMLKKGHLHFALHGARSTGGWSLIRMHGSRAGDGKRENWLLVKDDDEAAVRKGDLAGGWSVSVQTGRDLKAIAADGPPAPPARPRTKARPKFRKPQLAELVPAPPEGAAWWHEVKFDGYRALVALGKGGPRIFTRNGHDWTEKFAELVPALDALPCEAALIDGEIVAGAGLSGFGTLQTAIRLGGPFRFYAFDLLELDGKGLADGPLADRRKALEVLFAQTVPLGILQLSPVLEGEGAGFLSTICEAGGEGLVSKLRDAPYRGTRSGAWQKSKCRRRREFGICGWLKGTSRGRPLRSLLLCEAVGGKLEYRGKVGTGFNDLQDELLDRLGALAADRTPLDRAPAETRGAHWVRPRLMAEVDYAEETADGRLRHPVFLGLRADKVMEVAMDETGDRPKVAGIGISSPDRVVFPKPKLTKLDLAEYYAAMADRMLPDLARRPLSLVRLPEGLAGERFFQKHLGKGFPAGLHEVNVAPKGETPDARMYLTDARGLVAAAQMGTVEFHITGVRTDRLDRPDRMVLDLDPDEGLGFARVRAAAVLLRDVLAEAGLASAPLVTGGKGVHVVVPLRRVASLESVVLFAKLVASALAQARPKEFTATLSKSARKGRIFIDYLRNETGGTAVAPFSVRAREGAPVAVPVSWDELAGLRSASGFSLKAALERQRPELPQAGAVTEAASEKAAAAIAGL